MVVPLYEMTVFRPDIKYSEAITRSKKQGKVIDALIFTLPALLGALYYKRRESIDDLVKKTFEIVVNKATELKLLKM